MVVVEVMVVVSWGRLLMLFLLDFFFFNEYMILGMVSIGIFGCDVLFSLISDENDFFFFIFMYILD